MIKIKWGSSVNISFSKPFIPEKTLQYIHEALNQGRLIGDGHFSQECHTWLEKKLNCRKALLTPSGTAALEMAAILADIQPGDEVIMPSFTFVSTANAFVLRGGVPVFVDIRPDTCNLDETKIEAAISRKTKVIVPVHYAGVACEMDAIMALADKYNLLVIEDAAHGILSSYKEKPLGSIGHLAALSFHETKNLTAGEGGALLINDLRFVERAEIIREKGTNRSKFFRGEIDQYSWVDLGSSYLPNELTAACLWAQFEEAEQIMERRLAIWDKYHQSLWELEKGQKIRRPIIPSECEINGHIYYLLVSSLSGRTSFINKLGHMGIKTVFHYVPLHNSPSGLRYGRTSGKLGITEKISDCLVRLPLWLGLEEHLSEVIQKVIDTIRE
jgi:dTDP-4-amino-4,6-dideoxygalactose transaminase